jgi:hypothetical protein
LTAGASEVSADAILDSGPPTNIRNPIWNPKYCHDGKTIVAPSGTDNYLNSLTFYLCDNSAAIGYQAYVHQWNGNSNIGLCTVFATSA